MSQIIKVSFSKAMENLMITRGLDRIVLANKRHSFDLEESITSFKPIIQNVKSKTIGVDRQMKMAQALIDKPFKGTGVHVINSFPSHDLYW